MLLTEVTGQGDSLYLWDAAGLVTEECWPVLRGGYQYGSLGKDNKCVSFGVKVVDHDVSGRGFGGGEKTELIGQGIYLLLAKRLPHHYNKEPFLTRRLRPFLPSR
jgi:hypothetical protein